MRVCNYLELEDRLARAGIGSAADQQRAALERAGDVEVLTSPWRGGSPVGAARSLLAGEGAFRGYDVAHCNLIGPGSVAVARHARRTGRPLVLHAHVTREDFAGSFRGSTTVAPALGRYLRWFYSQADLVLCPSEYTRGLLREYPVDAPIEPVTNGVDRDALAGHEEFRDEYRERYGLEDTVVFAMGNVFERKGLETFCRLAETTDYEFAWFGTYDTGPHASPVVRERVKNPPPNCTFTGWIEDRRGAFGAGDVFCFPAHEENQGIVVLEAMATGNPVIARDIPVFREYFTDGEDCLLCATDDEFRAALERVTTDADLRADLVAGGYETAAAHDLERVGEELRGHYETARDLAAERGD
ncbi:MAG: glycosyltransferase family 4 protein [Halobacteriaceae archaeon]